MDPSHEPRHPGAARASESPAGSAGRLASPGTAYWDSISDRASRNYYLDPVIGQLKRDAHLRLISRWCGDVRGKTLLKTDLFEEAHGADQFLFEVPPGGLRVGLDISASIARRAREQAVARGVTACALIQADVRVLPFRDHSLDIIVSNSTLDHFADPQCIDIALRELGRALKAGGTLVVTFDNPHSLSYLVGRLKRLFRPAPFFMGHTLSRRELRARLVRIGYLVTDTTAILHGFENHSTAAMRLARRLGGPRFHRAIKTALLLLERLEMTPTCYVTGAFVAARAVKPEVAANVERHGPVVPR